MNLEDNLRDRLEAVETPPTRIDVETLVDAGRRRAFRRRSAEAVGGVALVAAVLLAVPSVLNAAKGEPTDPPAVADSSAPSSAPPAVTTAPTPGPTASPPSPTASTATPTTPVGRCGMAKLPVPNNMADVSAAAVDPTGRYIVGNDVVGQNFRAVLWTDGHPRALPVVGESVQATAVNSSGVVVGLVTDGSESEVFRYRDGEFTRLRTPAGSWHVFPVPAINSAGDVVINAEPRGNSGGEGSIVLLWKADATTATRLPLPADANVLDINDEGTLVGALYRDGSATDAYAWDQRGKGRKLSRPAGVDGAAAYAVSGEWATGGVWENSNGRAVLWNIRTGAVTDLETLEPGNAVNAAGWVVNATGQVVRDGPYPRLDVPDGQVPSAKDVSDTGLVVGQAVEDKPDGGASLGPRTWQC